MRTNATSSVMAMIIALTGCTAAYLIPQDAFAAQRRAVRANVSHAAVRLAPRPVFRSAGQSRPTSFHPTASFARPTFASHPNFGANAPRFGGVSHASSFNSGLPRAGSLGGNLSHQNRLAGTFPQAGSLGNNFPHANSFGGSHPASFGGNVPHPDLANNFPHANSLGNGFPHANGFGGSHPNSFGGTLPRPGFASNFPHVNSFGSGAQHLASLTDHRTIGDKLLSADAAQKTDFAAGNKLRADIANHAPPAVIAADQAAFINARKAFSAAEIAVNQAQAAAAGNATKLNAGTSGSAAGVHPQIECIRAPCPTHLPNGQPNPGVSSFHPGGQGSSAGGQAASGGGSAGGSSSGNSPAGGSSSASDGSASVAPAQLAQQPIATVPQLASQTAATAPTLAPTAAQTSPEFVFVAFQNDLTATDMATFLQAYKVAIIEGPTQNGVYKLRLLDPVPADQLQQVVDSMKTQTAMVVDAAAA